jgi:hypothetical protein
VLWAGQGDSGEQSWPQGREIGHAKVRASSSEGGGMLRTKAGAQGEAKSTGHRVGVANRRDLTPARPN